MARFQRNIDGKKAAHWLALLAVFSQICLAGLCECGISPRGDVAFDGPPHHAHHGAHAAPGQGGHHHGDSPASRDDCNACRVTCGSTALVTALFILLALALIPLRRERRQTPPIWFQNYSGQIFDGRAPPLSV